MNSDKIIENTSYSEYVDYIQSVVTTYEKENENKYWDVKKDINTLIDKINDNNLYLGVVGSFSSGKSTFINSVIHKNLLPTDAVQGTTVAASILKKADFDDLKITYNDGRISKFSENPNEMLLQYQILENIEPSFVNNHQSFIEKIIAWLKKLFGIRNETNDNSNNIDVETCITLFKKIISTEELASDIKYVTLYYKNANIPYRIAMVDTPGTESLNKRHNEVTKNAIDNICDAVVVIIPYDEPVSEELLDYVNTNLGKRKSECIFIVTKVELLGDRDELPQLLQVIRRRLENGLAIESACVIPMPTLIYLKNVDLEMKTTFLNDISDADRNELIEMYEDGIAKINKLLEQNKNEYIKKKIISICERVSLKLNSNLTDVVNDYEEKNHILQDKLVKPLSEFEILSNNEIINYCKTSKQRLTADISFIQVQFSLLSSKIEKAISECIDSQQLINQLNFSCKDTLEEIQELISQKLSESQNGLNSKLKNIEKNFNEAYSKCGINSNIELMTNVGTQFLNDIFIPESETLMEDKIKEIKSSIKNDTNGLLNKVKLFFSNPISKHKEMALNGLLNTIEILNQNTKTYVLEFLNQFISNNEKRAQNNLESIIENNRNIIENYTNSTVRALEDNANSKANTEACIEQLNQYIKNIKEAG